MIVEQRLDVVGHQFVEHQFWRRMEVGFEPRGHNRGEDGVEHTIGMACRVRPRMNAVGTIHLVIGDVPLVIGPSRIKLFTIGLVQFFEIIGGIGHIAVGYISIIPNVEKRKVVVFSNPGRNFADITATGHYGTRVLEIAADGDDSLGLYFFDSIIDIVECPDECSSVL